MKENLLHEIEEKRKEPAKNRHDKRHDFTYHHSAQPAAGYPSLGIPKTISRKYTIIIDQNKKPGSGFFIL